MSNSPVDPTFPEPHQSPSALSMSGFDDAAFETVGQTVRHAAGALEGLRDILERLETSITRAVDHRQTEEQFGQLFLRAQAFVDASIAEAHERARRVVLESEHEAIQIISAARDEAKRILEEGHRASRMPVEAAHQLQSTVEHFGEVNQELLREFTALGELLTGRPRPETTPKPVLPEQYLSRSAGPPNEVLAPPNKHQPAPPSASSSSTGYWDTPRHSESAPRVQANRRGFASRTGRWRRYPGH